jgi:hypothetical protein
MENKLHPQCRLIEIIIENQELDNVTKLRLVQPLLFGDNVIEVSQKFKVLDIWDEIAAICVNLIGIYHQFQTNFCIP